MKILIITQFIPYPLSEGGKIAQFNVIDYLRNKSSITLLLFSKNELDFKSIQQLKEIWNNVDFEIISEQKFHQENSISKFKKVLKYILKYIDYTRHILYKYIEFEKIKIKVESTNVEDNLEYLISFAKPRNKNVINQVSHVIYNVKPDLIQLDFIETLDLALCIPKEIKKIFVHHEIRFRRLETELKTIKYNIGSYGRYVQNLCDLLEVNLLNKFDGIVTFSEEDKSRLLERLSITNILSSPFCVLNSEIIEIKPENLLIKKLVFVGLEKHSPNRDAIEWYALHISKEIYERLGLVLHVIGDWSEDFKLRHSDNPAIIFTDFVKDLSGYCMNSVMVVPLRIGSGIRTKILHSMAWGVPVISTSIGCEGIIENENIFCIANESKDFVHGINKIVTDEIYRTSIVCKAQSILKKHYTQNNAGEKRFMFYKSLLPN